MLDKRNSSQRWIALLALLILVSQPAQAFAWNSEWQHYPSHDRHQYRHHHQHHHSYPSYGKVVFGLPFGFISLYIGGSRYYYCDGVFYHQHGFDYVVTPPPIGAAVSFPPADCERYIINGVTYYSNEDVYFEDTRQGYVVVSPPTMVIETARAGTIQSAKNAEGSYTVNIPNAKGGYTAVLLKKSGDGFTGPQGEFYSEFPSVEQLRLMYGK